MALDDLGDTRKSVLRSIRVSARLAADLQREAHERRVSVNSLVSSILEKYSEWDIMAEKFGFVQVSCDAFQQLLNAVSAEELAEVAREAGRSVSRDLMMFWFKEVNVSNVLRYIRLISHYQRLFTLEFTQLDGRLIIVLHHSFGAKGSVWFSNFMREVVKANVKLSPTTEETRNSVKMEIPLVELETLGHPSTSGNDFLFVR